MKIKDTAWIAFSVLIFGYVIYKIARNSFTDHFLGNNPQITKAIIIDEKNYMGNRPVKPKFSYSYLFTVNGKEYKGNAHDSKLTIGDTVEVKYNSDYPSINKPLHPKE